MHLQRVRVPDFRVLQDVDIEFEKEFSTKVFPLGSQNGGGKSTLLQLIFVLLHCSQDPERRVFLQNFLEGFQIPVGLRRRDLASFQIWDGEKPVLLEFFCCNDSYLAELVESSSSEEDGSLDIGDLTDIKFYISDDLQQTEEHILITVKNIKFLTAKIAELKNQTAQLQSKKQKVYENYIINLRKTILSSLDVKKRDKDVINERMQELSGRALSEELENILNEFKSSLVKQKNNISRIENCIVNTRNILEGQNLLHICNYWSYEADRRDLALLCRLYIDIAEAQAFLQRLSRQIFLAAPVTQVFLFLPKETRKLLFRTQEKKNDYYGQFEKAREKLPGLFAYDFLAVDLLVESFKAARDRDFSEAIETGGKYGNHYQTLLNQLKSILFDKIVNINQDLSGVTLKLDRDGKEVELYPEDLSHGELKRLSIYIWLKHRNIEDAIVLMDEIEIAFHPDWQFQIVRDLQEWAPSNQYILATHSYDLCEAVTPAHVKELEPKLLKSGAEE